MIMGSESRKAICVVPEKNECALVPSEQDSEPSNAHCLNVVFSIYYLFGFLIFLNHPGL